MEVMIRREIEIDAPPALVWSVLVDLDRYPEWNPFTPRMESSLAVGDPVRMRVALRPGWRLPQTEYVSAHVTHRKLCWRIQGVPAFLLAAERCQELEALGSRRTRYVNADRFRGALIPLVMALFRRDLDRGFEAVCVALKQRVEGLAQPGG